MKLLYLATESVLRLEQDWANFYGFDLLLSSILPGIKSSVDELSEESRSSGSSGIISEFV